MASDEDARDNGFGDLLFPPPAGFDEIDGLSAFDWILQNDDRIRSMGIEPIDVASCLDCKDDAVTRVVAGIQSELERVERLQQERQTHLVRRGEAQGASTIKYLTAIILEAYVGMQIPIPTPLYRLIRAMLEIEKSREKQELEIAEKRRFAAMQSGWARAHGRTLSARAIAAHMGVSVSTLLRWFKEATFEEESERWRLWYSSEEFSSMQEVAAEIQSRRAQNNVRNTDLDE